MIAHIGACVTIALNIGTCVITVVCEQANRRPDSIRQIIYKDEEQDRA